MKKTFWVLEKSKELLNTTFKIAKGRDGDNVKEVVAAIRIQTGLSESKIMDYLKTWENYGALEFKNGLLIVKDTYTHAQE